jgi:integrase/recombinase XerD
MGRPRTHVPVEEWPPPDRARFEGALQSGTIFESGGLARHWSPYTVNCAAKAYGHWLAYCRHAGFRPRPVGAKMLTGYVAEMKARKLSSVTIFGRVRDLGECLRVMRRSKDQDLVSSAVRQLRSQAKPERDRHSRLIAPSQLYYAGIGRMDRTWVDALRYRCRAMEFSDGLMMALLAAKPVRRKNLFGMQVGKHIQTRGNSYELKFEPGETKNQETIAAELPASLTAYIDHWLKAVRPFLIDGVSSRHFWVTSVGTAMAQDTGYARFCRATKDELNMRINLHLVRHIVATGVAIGAPEHIGILPYIMGHRTKAIAQEYYNLAGAITASDRFLEQLELRRAAKKMSTK